MNSTIRINGEPEPLRVANVYDLLRSKDIKPDSRGVAVALNGKVLRRDAWESTTLSDGDTVDIVKPFAGG